MGVYERNKDSHFSRMWRSSLFRDTKEHVSKDEIDRIYSIEYDTLFKSPLIDQEIARKFGWKLDRIEYWLGEDVDLGRHDTFLNMVKSNTTNKVYDLYWPRFQEEHQEPEPYDEDADVQRLEKQAEEAFESRLYGQTRN